MVMGRCHEIQKEKVSRRALFFDTATSSIGSKRKNTKITQKILNPTSDLLENAATMVILAAVEGGGTSFIVTVAELTEANHEESTTIPYTRFKIQNPTE